MNREEEKEAKEREIFCKFADISKNYKFVENRKPLEPDILAVDLQTNEHTRFELVELVIPSEYSESDFYFNKLKLQLHTELDIFFKHKKLTIRFHYDVIRKKIQLRQKNITRLIDFLKINNTIGEYINNSLSPIQDIVEVIRIKEKESCEPLIIIGNGINPQTISSPDELLSFYCREKINEKNNKTYDLPNNINDLNLLLYGNGSFLFRVFEDFSKFNYDSIKETIKSSKFKQIYLFDSINSIIHKFKE